MGRNELLDGRLFEVEQIGDSVLWLQLARGGGGSPLTAALRAWVVIVPSPFKRSVYFKRKTRVSLNCINSSYISGCAACIAEHCMGVRSGFSRSLIAGRGRPAAQCGPFGLCTALQAVRLHH